MDALVSLISQVLWNARQMWQHQDKRRRVITHCVTQQLSAIGLPTINAWGKLGNFVAQSQLKFWEDHI